MNDHITIGEGANHLVGRRIDICCEDQDRHFYLELNCCMSPRTGWARNSDHPRAPSSELSGGKHLGHRPQFEKL